MVAQHGLLELHVTDCDSALNAGPFLFDIRRGNTLDAFRVDPNGTLRTARAEFHREKQEVYELVVVVSDQGVPPLSSSVR